MGYQITVTDLNAEQTRKKTEEETKVLKVLKEVKQHASNADYCDFSEGISAECLALYDAIKNRGAQTDQETATRLANQMRCLQKGLSVGLNP
jgi:hypothetical protein